MRTDLERLGDDLRVVSEQRFLLSNMDMAKDAWSATQRYFRKVHGIELGQPPLNIVGGVAYKDTVEFVSMKGKER